MCTDNLITYLPNCSRVASATRLRVLKYDTKEKKKTLYHQVIQKRYKAAF